MIQRHYIFHLQKVIWKQRKPLSKEVLLLNNTNKNDATPLLLGARYGKTEVFCYLTEIGADINIPDTRKNTTLHNAAFSDNFEIIIILLDKGMYVDLTNAEISIPLHLSALTGNLETTIALVERGAPLNNANKNDATPLLLGARYGKTDVFHYLTQTGTDVKGTPLLQRAFVALRLPIRADKCSSIESSAFFKSTYIPFTSKIVILSTISNQGAL